MEKIRRIYSTSGPEPARLRGGSTGEKGLVESQAAHKEKGEQESEIEPVGEKDREKKRNLPHMDAYFGSEIPSWVKKLHEGVTEGHINRDEFRDLFIFQMESVEIRARMEENGLVDEEKRVLRERAMEFLTLRKRYMEREEYPELRINDTKLIEQAERIHSGIRDGTINQDEFAYLVRETHQYCRLKGLFSWESSEEGVLFSSREKIQLEKRMNSLTDLVGLMEEFDYRW